MFEYYDNQPTHQRRLEMSVDPFPLSKKQSAHFFPPRSHAISGIFVL